MATTTTSRKPAARKATGSKKSSARKASTRKPAQGKPASSARQQAAPRKVTKAQLAQAIALVHTTDAEAPAKGHVFTTETRNGKRVWVRLEALAAPLAKVLGEDEPLGKLAVRAIVVEAHGFQRQPFSYLSAGNPSGTDSRSYYYSGDRAFTQGEPKKAQAKATVSKANAKAKAWRGRK